MTRKRAVLVLVLALAVIATAVGLVLRSCSTAAPSSRGPLAGLSADPRASALRAHGAPSVTGASTVPLARQRFELRGRVVDAGGRSVAAARVTATTPAGEVIETTTDAAGEFRFDDRFGGVYVLAAQHDGGASLAQRVLLDEHTALVVLRIGPAATLTVRTVDAQRGGPVVDTEVVVRSTFAPGDPRAYTARTDRDGRARFNALAPGTYEVIARAAGHRIVSMPLPPQAGLAWQLELALQQGIEVRGRVVDDAGAPRGGAVIAARPADQDVAFEPRRRPGPLGVVTGPDGRFVIVLEPGQHLLVAHHPAFLPSLAVAISIDRTPPDEVTLVLDRGASIGGQVVDAAGVPAAGAVVRAAAVDFGVRGAAMQQTVADAEGGFHLQGLPPAPVVLVAELPGATSEDTPFDLGATPHVRGVRIELGVDGRIEGSVVDGDGVAIAGAQVICVGNPGAAIGIRPIAPVTADEDGHFACTGLPIDDYELTAMRPLPNNATSPWMRSSGASARTGDRDVKIVIPRDGAIAGRVRIGKRWATEFGVQLDEGGSPLPVRSGDGTFHLAGLAPRRYDLRITALGARPLLVEGVLVPEDGTLELGELRLEAFGDGSR